MRSSFLQPGISHPQGHCSTASRLPCRRFLTFITPWGPTPRVHGSGASGASLLLWGVLSDGLIDTVHEVAQVGELVGTDVFVLGSDAFGIDRAALNQRGCDSGSCLNLRVSHGILA